MEFGLPGSLPLAERRRYAPPFNIGMSLARWDDGKGTGKFGQSVSGS